MIGSFATFDVTGFDLHLSSKLVTIKKKYYATQSARRMRKKHKQNKKRIFFISQKYKGVAFLCVNCDQVLQFFLPDVLMKTASNS